MKPIEIIVNTLSKEICKNAFTLPKVSHLKIDSKILIATSNGLDYYIYFDLPYSSLQKINTEIQIRIFKHLGKYIREQTDNNISPLFEKNAHLIISSQIPPETPLNDVLTIVSRIEEDPYYFKKQIIYYNSNALTSFMDEYQTPNNINNNASLSEHLNRIVLDADRYDAFILNNDAIYSFASLLFEKIPFLTLSVTPKSKRSINSIIQDKLTTEEAELLPFLLNSLGKDTDKISSWIDSLE